MDLEELFFKSIKELVGKVCWQTSLTIGSTLMLDFGRKLTYDPPMINPNSGSAVEIGEYNFLIFSAWRIENDSRIIATWKDKFWNLPKLDESIAVLVGKSVRFADISAPSYDLDIVFDDHTRLKVFCDSFTSGQSDKNNYYYSTYKDLFAVKSCSSLIVKGQDMKRVFV